MKRALKAFAPLRKNVQPRNRAIILFGRLGLIALGRCLGFVFLERIASQAEAQGEGKRRFLRQRLKPQEDGVRLARLGVQLAPDRAADIHPLLRGQRFLVSHARDQKPSGGYSMWRQDFDDALSFSLEIRDLHRLGEDASGCLVEFLEARRQVLARSHEINDGARSRL